MAAAVLAELLAASKDFAGQIYAWEVINEPFWLCHQFGELSGNPPFSRTPEVSIDQMKTFLIEATKRIEAAGFPSTVGHRYFSDLSVLPSGSTRQFHYYAKRPFPGYSDPSGIKDQHLFTISPIPVLGEFDSDLNLHSNPWPDLKGGDTTLARLRLLESVGCRLALIWPDLPDSDPVILSKDIIKLSEKTRMEIAAFTHGVLPPPDRKAPH